MEEFDARFTGVVLVMEPGDGLHPGRRKPGVLRRHARPGCAAPPGRCRPRCWRACCWSLVGAAVPALSRTYIDMFLIGGQTSLLGVLFASMARVCC